MAQAGQPQKLEEDLEQDGGDEPEAQQPDQKVLERGGAPSQQVSRPLVLRTGDTGLLSRAVLRSPPAGGAQ